MTSASSMVGRFRRDQIHHRGQSTIYLRMAGGNVPSVYRPTANEPWM